jgi:uncharacterized membrane protein
MTSRVAARSISSDRSVSGVCGATLVVAFFVSSVFFFVGPASAVYVAEDIGFPSGYATAVVWSINDFDQVVGNGYSLIGDSHAVVYDPGTGGWTVLSNPGLWASADAISDDGDIIGCGRESTTSQVKGIYWPPGYEDEMIVLEPPSGGVNSYAQGVNDLGEAVGDSFVDGDGVVIQWDLDPLAVSITPQVLGSVEGKHTVTNDINNNHAVVGYAYDGVDSRHCQAFYCAGLGEPIQFLQPLSEGVDGPDAVAWAISDSGLIVGHSRDDDAIKRAVAWQPPYDGPPIDLEIPTGISSSEAFDVNSAEKIVGRLLEMGCGFVYDFNSGTLEYLESPSGGAANLAIGINDGGHIAGLTRTSGDELHAVLWTPDAPPVAAFTMTMDDLIVTVDASASYDHEGAIASYVWDFGDESVGYGEVVEHTYAGAGHYVITLTVTDSVGQTDSFSLLVSDLATPKTEVAKLIDLIYECTIDEDIKDRLAAKASHALDLIEARKTHGDPAANILLSFDNLVSQYVLVGKIAFDYEAWSLIAQANFVISLLTDCHMIGGVPVYTWHHGCGPTATGMVLGYWDSNGYDELVKGPQGNEMFQSDEANAMIASENHVRDYVYPLDGWVEKDGTLVWVDVKPDKSELGGATDDDCLADFMHTSRSKDGLVYGQSFVDMVDDALVDYTEWASDGSYRGTASVLRERSLEWEEVQAEIDAARPMVFVIDWNGDGATDHLVTVLGYCEVGNARLYAFYSTWDDYVWWACFDVMDEGSFYGVYAGVMFSISSAQEL